jgi:hypothetical protein
MEGKMLRKTINFLLSAFILSLLFTCATLSQQDLDKAENLRKKVHKYELKKYAEEDYTAAEKNYDEMKILIEKKNTFKAVKVLAVVKETYQKVLDKGLPPYTDERDADAKKEYDNAIQIKANVAIKDQFDEANKVYTDGKSLKDSKDYENAIDKFNDSKDKFNYAYKTAKDKRDKAETSINKTEEYKKDVESNAAKIDKRIEDIKKDIEEGGK